MSDRSADDRRAAWRRGRAAERFVAEHLASLGWRLIDQNWLAQGGELDLVVAREGEVRFVEVRSRQPGDQSALESVHGVKRRRLTRAAEAWLLAHPEPAACAFMVAVVTLDPAGWTVELLDDAFDAEGR